MEVTEQESHEVHTWFEEQMGPERAAVFKRMITFIAASDLATKHDLRELEHRFEALEARLDARFEALEARLDARFEALEARLDARFDARFDAQNDRFEAQDARFDARLEALRSSTLRTVGTWLFASQAAVITAIGVATGVIVAFT